MIAYDEQHGVFRLDTPHTSYCMGLVDGKYLGHLYYGKKLSDMDLSYLFCPNDAPLPPSADPAEKGSFIGCFPAEYPTSGTGDFRESCVDVRTQKGQNGLELLYQSHRIYQGKEPLTGLPSTFGKNCDTLEITLRDAGLSFTVILSYTAFTDTDVITRTARMVNEGTSFVMLTRALSASLTLPDDGMEILTLNGAWARERHIERQKLSGAGTVIESVRGEPGHVMHPFFALLTPGTDQTKGEVYAMNFVYSGNFLAKVQRDQYGQLRAVMGIHPQNFSWKLLQNESFQAPEVVLTYSSCGLNGMTHTFHDFYRNHLIRSPWLHKRRPILINNWEATYFDYNSDKLLSIAKEAGKAGIEMLVMDDGWFGAHRDAPTGSLGDWVVNKRKIPEGLKSFSDKVHAEGLKFGLWFEPEMVSFDSDLYRAHPDWVLRTADRRPVMIRDQAVLDFCRPETVEYITESIAKILRSAKIEYLKWDMNRSLCDLGSAYLSQDQQGEISHRHVLALYRIQGKLLEEFPDLLLENCSSGGARFDPGMLYFSPQIWCSDNMDPMERLMITEGTALIYPLSTIGSHVCKSPNDITGRETPFETRALVSMLGNFGYELDITRLPEEERKMIPCQIALYKKVAPLIREGDYYHIASFRENHIYDCTEIVSKDKTKAVMLFVQVLSEANVRGRIIRLQGLDADKVYEIEGRRYHGDTLMNAGFVVERIKGDFRAKLFEIQESDSVSSSPRP